MKKTWAATGLAALFPFVSSYAFAQSSETLYGRLDVGMEYKTGLQKAGGATANALRSESGDWGATYFGFRGTEDLGGDLSAIYDLEAGFNLDSGSLTGGNGVLWGRMAYVGLSSNTYGILTAGRNLAMPNNQWDMDPFMQEYYSSTTLSRNRTAPVTNNTISYQSPTFGGFDVYAQYGLGNASTGFNNGTVVGGYGRTDGVQLTYHYSGLELRTQYDELRDANGRFSNIFVSSREIFAGAAYKIRNLTLQAGFSHLSAPDTPTGLASTAYETWFGGKYLVKPAWEVEAAVFHVQVDSGNGDATHDAGGHATMVALGTMYHLSKSTFLYATAAHVENAAHSTFGVGATNPGLDNSNSDDPLAGHGQTGVYVGMMKYF